MLVRPMVHGDTPIARPALPGDLLSGGENLLAGALTTVGAGTWLASMIANGLIRRTGPVGGYTDTTDTAESIRAALAGNLPNADVAPGTSFRLLFQNTVALAMTFAAGIGCRSGTGTLNCAASIVREYLVTILNSTPRVNISSATTNASAVVTFNLPPGQTGLPFGSVTPGMTVDDGAVTITAGTRVLAVTNGPGGMTGVTLDANAIGTSASVGLNFGPTIQFDGLRSSTL